MQIVEGSFYSWMGKEMAAGSLQGWTQVALATKLATGTDAGTETRRVTLRVDEVQSVQSSP